MFTKIKKSIVVALFCLIALPAMVISQPVTPGDNGGFTEAAVPFDDTMNLVFLAVGLLFAAIVVVRQKRLEKPPGRQNFKKYDSI